MQLSDARQSAQERKVDQYIPKSPKDVCQTCLNCPIAIFVLRHFASNDTNITTASYRYCSIVLGFAKFILKNYQL